VNLTVDTAGLAVPKYQYCACSFCSRFAKTYCKRVNGGAVKKI